MQPEEVVSRFKAYYFVPASSGRYYVVFNTQEKQA